MSKEQHGPVRLRVGAIEASRMYLEDDYGSAYWHDILKGFVAIVGREEENISPQDLVNLKRGEEIILFVEYVVEGKDIFIYFNQIGRQIFPLTSTMFDIPEGVIIE